jgi:uncharacterized membrane protein (UPF0127 family)
MAPEFVKVRLGSHNFLLEFCRDNEAGLIGRKILEDGMIFQFPDSSQKVFHTKGCIEPIDIVFCNKGQVQKIYHDCQPNSEEMLVCLESDTVIELPSGTCFSFSIKDKDVLQFLN